MSKPRAALYPISPDWICPSLIWGEVALCRSRAGAIWFCTIDSESKGWKPAMIADDVLIKTFRICQEMAGKDISKIPL